MTLDELVKYWKTMSQKSSPEGPKGDAGGIFLVCLGLACIAFGSGLFLAGCKASDVSLKICDEHGRCITLTGQDVEVHIPKAIEDVIEKIRKDKDGGNDRKGDSQS